jgi:hypothetical protein
MANRMSLNSCCRDQFVKTAMLGRDLFQLWCLERGTAALLETRRWSPELGCGLVDLYG